MQVNIIFFSQTCLLRILGFAGKKLRTTTLTGIVLTSRYVRSDAVYISTYGTYVLGLSLQAWFPDSRSRMPGLRMMAAPCIFPPGVVTPLQTSRVM
ncbi:hypothetical protein AAHC03_01599 [Spirometra sp. Aus1]